MLGPVYALEWLQASRRSQKTPWRWIYTAVLFLEMQWLTINLVEFLSGLSDERADPSYLSM